MRHAMAFAVVIALAAPAFAQYPPNAYVDIDTPSNDCIVVIQPTQPGTVFRPDGTGWGSFDVQVGQSDYDHWGDCWFDEPLLSATSLLIQPYQTIDGLTLLEEPLPLDASPPADGWTTVNLGHLRGGGYTDGPALMFATVPDYSLCYLQNSFTIEVRSPDINGDLAVDLSDIVVFAQALGEYRAYADFRPDGIINLSDVVVMSQALHGR